MAAADVNNALLSRTYRPGVETVQLLLVRFITFHVPASGWGQNDWLSTYRVMNYPRFRAACTNCKMMCGYASHLHVRRRAHTNFDFFVIFKCSLHFVMLVPVSNFLLTAINFFRSIWNVSCTINDGRHFIFDSADLTYSTPS